MKVWARDKYDKPEEPRQLTKEEKLLLQARHLLNEITVEKVIDGGGFTTGSDDLILKVNRMAFGLFEATLLKAMKDNDFLRNRNPDLFVNEVTCPLCSGKGKFPYAPGTPEYEKVYQDFYCDLDGKQEADAPDRGTPIAKFCSPCQGTGIVLKKQR